MNPYGHVYHLNYWCFCFVNQIKGEVIADNGHLSDFTTSGREHRRHFVGLTTGALSDGNVSRQSKLASIRRAQSELQTVYPLITVEINRLGWTCCLQRDVITAA